MEENTRDGENTETSAGTRQSGQLLPNDTMNRTADRTCTQKLTILTLEKQEQANASIGWSKFVQYIKVTKDIDLSTMTNSKEILPQYRGTKIVTQSTRNRYKRHFYLGNRTKCYHGDDKNGQGKRTELITTSQTSYTLSTTLHPRKERSP